MDLEIEFRVTCHPVVRRRFAMPAYVIAEVDVSDTEMFKAYLDLVPKTALIFCD